MKHLPASLLVPSLIVLLGWIFSSFTPGRADDSVSRQDKLNGGYYLLHHLCGDEDQLPLLLDVKHAPDSLVKFADKISKQAKESNAILEHLQDRNPAIKFDRNPLPPIERDVRESITGEKQHQLLFGTSDAAFARALLVSQIEATSYAANLAKVLAGQESDPQRVKELKRISDQWSALHEEAFRLLAAVQ